MAYTPATQYPTAIKIFQWQRPEAPNPRLAAPITATDTTLTFTSPPLDYDGVTVITGSFLMGIKNDAGYVETIWIPSGKISADGLTATDVVRGIRLSGLDYTTSLAGNAAAFNQDSPVFCNISAVERLMLSGAFTGTIASGGTSWTVGAGAAADINFEAYNDQTAKPKFYFDDSAKRWMLSRGDDEGAGGASELSGFMKLTTTERNALGELPAGGIAIYNTTTGQTEWREGGAWVANAAGGTVADASETVAGKVELATNAEMRAGTSAGGTGARLVPPNDQLIATSSGAADQGKIDTLNANGDHADGFISDTSVLQHLTKSLVTGEAVTAGNALRIKENGLVYNAEKFKELSIWMEANSGSDPTTMYKCACTIAANKVVYIFEVGATVQAVVATWDGDVPTSGTVLSLTTTATGWTTTGYMDVCKVDTDKFAVVHWADTIVGVDDGEILVCTVSGTTITSAASATAFESGTQTGAALNRVCSPATDVVTVIWQNADTTDDLYARTATIATRTPTFGAEVAIDTTAGAGATSDVCPIDTNKVAIVHLGTDSDLYAEVCTISGNTMTEGADTELVDAITLYNNSIRASKVATNKFAAVYYDGTNIKIICSTVSGTTITPGLPVTVTCNYQAFVSDYIQLIYLSDNRCLLAFTDQNYPYTGIAGMLTAPAYSTKAYIVTFAGTVPTLYQIANSLYLPNADTWGVCPYLTDLVDLNGDQFQIFAKEITGNDNYVLNFADNNFIGFANASKNISEAVTVNLWKDGNQSAKVAGAKYYLDANGALALTGTVEAGTALSATEILKK